LNLGIRDRIKLATSPKNQLFEFLRKISEEFLMGKDDNPSSGNIGKVDAARALRLSTVFACNRVLSETLASCPIFMYEKDEKGNRRAVTDSIPYELLHYAPNPDMTPCAFKECGAGNINLGGNFYAQKVKNNAGNLIQLRPIEWHRVRMDRDKTSGQLLYFIDNEQQGRTRDSILHIPGLTLNGYDGITPIEYAQSALKVGIYQDDYTRRFYENGVLSSGVFKFPAGFTDQAFQRLKKDLKENYTGMKNIGIPMVLEEGGDFKEITMKLTDAQFIETKQFSVEDICRLYRVPLHLVQNLLRATNNNIEHQSLEFIIYTMLPWFKRWEENFNLQLLDGFDRRRNRYFEFKIDALLRGDAKTRAEAYAQGRQWGWLSVNDIRRMENMNDIGPAGDIYLQPMNMIEAGKEQTQQQKDNYNRLVEDIYNLIKDRGNVA
jgi:HK97 family phage portal protein